MFQISKNVTTTHVGMVVSVLSFLGDMNVSVLGASREKIAKKVLQLFIIFLHDHQLSLLSQSVKLESHWHANFVADFRMTFVRVSHECRTSVVQFDFGLPTMLGTVWPQKIAAQSILQLLVFKTWQCMAKLNFSWIPLVKNVAYKIHVVTHLFAVKVNIPNGAKCINEIDRLVPFALLSNADTLHTQIFVDT